MITVLHPGARSLVQDLGRPHHQHLGVPASGAADPYALHLANRLVGNAPDVAAIECAVSGPTLRFEQDTAVAWAGADTSLSLDGRTVPTRHTLAVRAGQVLTVGALRDGLLGYLSVVGGIRVPRVLGSRATCTLSGLGPAPLSEGTRLPLSSDASRCVPPRAAREGSGPSRSRLRVFPGPHADLFDAEALDRLCSQSWRVHAHSSRVGVRLDGSPLTAPQSSLPSLGMVRGAIQVPPSGEPIVLGPDHGATGGYPVLAVMAPQDLAVLMQRQAGAVVEMTQVAEATDAAESRVLRLDRIG